MRKINENDFIKFVGKQESQFIVSAKDFTDGVIERFNGVQNFGDCLPWSKTHGKVRLRPSEVSVWVGINGHGKSQILGQICAWGVKKNKWLIASLEMKPEATMHRMVRQIAGCEDVAEEYVKKVMNYTDGRLWIYDQLDTVKSERILGMIHYAAQELGIEHVIIDSLMKCGIGSDDYNNQKDFIDRLCWAAKSENIHIHLVAHVRKGVDEGNRPGKFDVKGCSEITDLVDNVFVVHRNKNKEKKQDLGEAVDNNEPDCTLTVAKQRHGEWEGVFLFWYHKRSMQYIPDTGNMAMRHTLDAM